MSRFKPTIIAGLFGTLGVLTAHVANSAQEVEPTLTVLLTNIEFKPNRIKVAVGDTVRFINKDKFDHDVYLVRTANRNDVIHAATTLHPGKSVTITIDQEGLFTLYCTIHGGMTGMITTTKTFELTEEEKKRAAAKKVIPPIVKVGETLYWGRAQCHRCHMVGERGDGLRGPNHQDLGFRAAARAQKFGLSSATEYITQSIMEPSAHIVEGYSDDMPNVYQPPINLSKEDITALVAYLQSQGGEVDTWSININPQILATELEPTPFRHGNAKRGERVFQDMGCGSCHTVGDRQAVSIAPELTAIGAYRNWTWLGKSIIDPNAEIGANWQDATVFLKPGVVVTSDQGFSTDEAFDEDELDEEDTESTGDTASLMQLAQARTEMEHLRDRIRQLEGKFAGDPAGTATSATESPSSKAADAKDEQPVASTKSEPGEDFEFGESVPGVLRKNTSEEVVLLVAPERFATFTGDQVARVVTSNKSRMAGNYGDLMTFRQLSDLVTYLESLRGDETPESAAASDGPNHHQVNAVVGKH